MTTVIDIRHRRNGEHVHTSAPDCSKCHGEGYRLFANGVTITGSRFGEAEEDFERCQCDACGGDGKADDAASIIASVAYEIQPFMEVMALGQWAACYPEGDEADIRAAFRWGAMVAWVTPAIRAAAGEVLVRHGFRIEEVGSSEAAAHRAMHWRPGPDAA